MNSQKVQLVIREKGNQGHVNYVHCRLIQGRVGKSRHVGSAKHKNVGNERSTQIHQLFL